MTLAGPAPAEAHERQVPATPAGRVRPPASPASAASAASAETVVVILADIAADARLWGYARFLSGRYVLPHFAGLRFARMLGSGHDGGFGLRPSFSRQGLLAAFADEISAARFLASPFVAGYRRRSREFLTAMLRAYSCRGSWGGNRLAIAAGVPASGPVVALTRASIRPSRAIEFWRRAPPAEASLAGAAGCLLAAGLGEAPLLRQATFSIWESVAAMDAYARTGAHLAAIRASHSGGYFSESMFVRFAPLALSGTWKGRAHG
jgi:spheroidene monooxygenase